MNNYSILYLGDLFVPFYMLVRVFGCSLQSLLHPWSSSLFQLVLHIESYRFCLLSPTKGQTNNVCPVLILIIIKELQKQSLLFVFPLLALLSFSYTCLQSYVYGEIELQQRAKQHILLFSAIKISWERKLRKRRVQFLTTAILSLSNFHSSLILLIIVFIFLNKSALRDISMMILLVSFQLYIKQRNKKE